MGKTRKRTSSKKASGGHRLSATSVTEGFKRTRQDHASEMGEDYVEIVDDLLKTQGEARLVDIAEHLGVSHVSAGRIIARLQREGLVQTKPYRAIFLTDDGKRLAGRARARHKLVFDLLRTIGVPAKQARIDAEGIEHHISATTLKAISRFLERKRE